MRYAAPTPAAFAGLRGRAGKICRRGIYCRGLRTVATTESPCSMRLFTDGTALAQPLRQSCRSPRAALAEFDHVACPRRRVVGLGRLAVTDLVFECLVRAIRQLRPDHDESLRRRHEYAGERLLLRRRGRRSADIAADNECAACGSKPGGFNRRVAARSLAGAAGPVLANRRR